MLPFSIGFSELLLVILVTFLIVGPEGIPQALRWIVKVVRHLRLMANDLRDQLNLDELKRELLAPVDELKRSEALKELQEVRRELREAHQELNQASRGLPPSPPPTPPAQGSESASSALSEAQPALPLTQGERPVVSHAEAHAQDKHHADEAHEQEEGEDEDEDEDEGPVAALDPLFHTPAAPALRAVREAHDVSERPSRTDERATAEEASHKLELAETPSSSAEDPQGEVADLHITPKVDSAPWASPASLRAPLISCPPMPTPLWGSREERSKAHSPAWATLNPLQPPLISCPPMPTPLWGSREERSKGHTAQVDSTEGQVVTSSLELPPEQSPEQSPAEEEQRPAEEEQRSKLKLKAPSDDRAPTDEHATFGSHMKELRARILGWVKGAFVVLILCVIFHESLYLIITHPLYESLARFDLDQTIKFRTINGPVMFYMKVCFISAFIFSMPVAFYQLWLFVRPGLYQSERRLALLFVGISSFFFFSGAVFSYSWLMPFAFDYNLSFTRTEGPYQLLADITLEDYLSTFKSLMLSVSFAFTLPVILSTLNYLDLLAYETLKRGWRWATVMSFIVAAILTPPDYVTQTLVAIPLSGLYWVGVIFAYVRHKRAKA